MDSTNILEALAAEAPQEPKQAQQTVKPKFDVKAWLEKNGVKISRIDAYHGGERLILETCVFNPDHKGTSVAVIVGADGAIGYACQHNGCADKHWGDVRGLFEPSYRERKAETNHSKNNRQNGDKPEKEPFNWQAHSITHDSLLEKPLPPLEFLVEGMIALPSLGIVAAPKKSAKSWLVLQLSQNVAAGTSFLGMATKQGSVIHLALEDGERRLRQRLEMQQTTKGLSITYVSHFEALNTEAGWNAFVEMVTLKKPLLIVIDTLAAAKNRYVKENDAGDMADLFNQLHNLAIAQNCAILVVAHHGKPKAFSNRDAGFDIRGSSAIPGATDINIGIYKNPDGTRDLEAEGRDIGQISLRVEFDAENTWCWHNLGDAKDARRKEAEERILDAIRELGGDVDTKAIADEAGITKEASSAQLKRMRETYSVAFKTVKVGRTKKFIYNLPKDEDIEI